MPLVRVKHTAPTHTHTHEYTIEIFLTVYKIVILSERLNLYYCTGVDTHVLTNGFVIFIKNTKIYTYTH